MSVEFAPATSGAPARRWKPYPDYKDSGREWVGKIPAHWDIKKLRRIFRVINGSTPKSGVSDYWDGDIVWVTPDDLGQLKSDTINVSARRITELGYQSCVTTLVPSGSLVLSTRAPIGHLAIAGIDLCTNQGCKIVVFKYNDGTRFFYYQLLTTRSELKSWGQGSTFKELGKDKLEAIELVSPTISEQYAIAAFLDRKTAHIDTLISKKERLITLLQEKRAALISHTVTKGLNPDVPMKDSGLEWLGEIPAHWVVQKLKNVAKVNLSNVDKKTNEDQDSIKLCNYVDVYYNDYITYGLSFMEATASFNQIEKFLLRAGDVIITKDSESWEDIAVPAYVPADLNDVICGYHLAHIRPDYADINGEYLFRSFCAIRLNNQFRIEAHGITRFGLGKYWIDNSLFPVPPKNEQKYIAAFLDRETAKLDALISIIYKAIEKLQEYRTALISAAVTGKIDVRNENRNYTTPQV